MILDMNNLFKKLLLASTVLCGVMSTNNVYSMMGRVEQPYNNISTNIYNILHNRNINM